MHGDSQKEWSMKEFRLFKLGSIWKPPHMNSYTAGMPEELVTDDDGKESTKGSLSNTQRDRLEDLIRSLTPERSKIGEVMVFCIEHSDAAEEVVDCITESLTNSSTLITKKIARLYLVSDILHNCGVKVNNASFYRKAFESRLCDIVAELKNTYDKLEGRLQAEGCKLRVLRIFQALDDSIYHKDYVNKLRTIFLGLKEQEIKEEPVVDSNIDIDGDPLQDQPETDDDVPMDGAALLKSAMKRYKQTTIPADDIDGQEIIEDPTDIILTKKHLAPLSGFIMSKWETVDPEQVEAQAMTTSKWDLLGSSADPSQDGSSNDKDDSNDYTDTRNMSEERRIKLREIEVKAMQYQDELESGQRVLKTGWTLPQQVEHYRRKLLKKSEKERKDKEPKGEKHKKDYEKSERKDVVSSDDEVYYKETKPRKSKKSSRSSSIGSSSKHRSRSRSPPKKKSFRGPSPPSPPHIRRQASPSSSRSRKKGSISPISSNGKYGSPSRISKSRRSPSPVKSRRKSISPRNRKSPSPRIRRGSTSPYRSKYHSPEVSRKHRHKHKY